VSQLFNCVDNKNTLFWFWLFSSMRLKLNASKTELIWFNRHPTSTTVMLHTFFRLGLDCYIKPADVVRDLGVLLDGTLSIKHQISSI